MSTVHCTPRCNCCLLPSVEIGNSAIVPSHVSIAQDVLPMPGPRHIRCSWRRQWCLSEVADKSAVFQERLRRWENTVLHLIVRQFIGESLRWQQLEMGSDSGESDWIRRSLHRR